MDKYIRKNIDLREKCEKLGESVGVTGSTEFTKKLFMFDSDTKADMIEDATAACDNGTTVHDTLVSIDSEVSSFIGHSYATEIESANAKVNQIADYAKALNTLESDTKAGVDSSIGYLCNCIEINTLVGLGLSYKISDVLTKAKESNIDCKALYSEEFGYINKDGQYVIFEWTISDEEFIDVNGLSLEQITEICNKHNPGLVERGFDVAIYRMCQELGVNPKVILATLGQEQGWCKPRKGDTNEQIERRYNKAFGVGPGGMPITFSGNECGGLAKSVRTFLNRYNEGKKIMEANNGQMTTLHVNEDKPPYPETKAVYGDNTANWLKNNPGYAQYMSEGLDVVPVNAAMYAKLRYTPWIDFPPQGSHPLQDWLKMYQNL